MEVAARCKEQHATLERLCWPMTRSPRTQPSARLMGFDPLQVRHLSDGSRFLGNLRADRITMLAEPVETRIRPFAVLYEFRYLVGQ